MMNTKAYPHINRVILTAVLSSFLFGVAACSDKTSEDVTAIRESMEKQEAEKAKQKQSDKEYMSGVKKGGAAPILDLKY